MTDYDPYTQCLPDIKLETERLVVRTPQFEDVDEWIEARSKNKRFLKPFEPTWPRSYLTKDFQIKRYSRQMREWASDHRYAFLVCDKKTGYIVGGVNVNNVTRFASQTAAFGYWIDKNFQQKGYMTEAVAIMVDFGFDILDLKRLEIACLLDNKKSQRIAEKLNFREIGIAKKYLEINGKRQDHVLFGLSKEDYSQTRTSPSLLDVLKGQL
jgi:ribosomal-protein-alanine N-acetyltransferase